MARHKSQIAVSIDNIWSFAIQREKEAARFYTELAETTTRHDAVNLFVRLAEEEREHERHFGVLRGLDFVDEGTPADREENPLETILEAARFGEHNIVKPENMGYREALEFAVKGEVASCNLYFALAERTGNERIREALCSLAKEEVHHRDKLRAELERCNK